MRYKVLGREVRSENAAKPWSQKSTYLVTWLRKNVDASSCLDFGCGKLRYSNHLRKLCKTLTIVDSELQLDRKQVINGVTTSVRNYVRKRWDNLRVLTTEQFDEHRAKYDFVLCSNVLSAIPSSEVRNAALQRMRDALKRDGRLLITSQYRNWYFKAVATSPRAKRHLDGWLVDSVRGPAYYGILDKEKISELCRGQGLGVLTSWSHGESAYVLAGKQSATVPPLW